jgi:integrase
MFGMCAKAKVRALGLGATTERQNFDAQYQAAIAGELLTPQKAATVGSLQWLIERYRETTAWTDLSLATRRNRENHFKRVLESAGDKPYRNITQAAIVAGKDRRAKTPAQARNFLDAMRGLFKWAKQAQHVSVDPTAGITNPKRKRGPGFPVWTEDEVDRYYKRWPLGTKERVWIDVLLFTGGRRGDAVRLGRQHVRDGVATFRTEKSQGEITVSIPVLPVLQETLDAGPIGDLAFICGANGQPLKKESFGTLFRQACRAAGVHKSAHGIRKLAATRVSDNQGTIHELNAVFGWKGVQMAQLYTQASDRKRLAAGAARLLVKNKQGISIPSPSRKVRASGQNPK